VNPPSGLAELPKVKGDPPGTRRRLGDHAASADRADARPADTPPADLNRTGMAVEPKWDGWRAR